MNTVLKILVVTLLVANLFGCTTTKEIQKEKISLAFTPAGAKTEFEIEFISGEKYNHPSFAIWLEDLEGKFIETLYVTQYVATGKFRYGELEPGKWKNEPGNVRRPATLPYWAHKRNIQAPDGLYMPSPQTPVADAVTGATPKGNFLMNSGTTLNSNQKFRVLFEMNQPWDSNKYWTNDKFAGDKDYFSSLQPALVYAVTVDPQSETKEYVLNPIGHSHPSGKTGELFTDLTTLTTAKDIAQKITLRLR